MSDEKPSGPLYYADYLQLDRLLSCQELQSARHGRPAHDEMLFIIVHQAYELWFKQVLWELDAVLATFKGASVAEEALGQAVLHLGRIVEIQRVLIQQVAALETMTPLDFLDFRDFLIPASGFQSAQFRLIENKLGMRRGDRLQINDAPYTARLNAGDAARVEASEREPSLFDLIEDWLERTPFLHFGDFDFWREYRRAVDVMLAADRESIRGNPILTDEEKSRQLAGVESTAGRFADIFRETQGEPVAANGRHLSRRALQAALLINLYRDEPILHLPFQLLALLADIERNFTTWRQRHAQMAMRMIGTRIGTGGTSGSEYLERAAERHKVFTDLSALASFYIPRSALPKLPPEVRSRMGFRFESPR
ncbi:MAG TPA: tryptophan 2,3-dioxygenase family protein [Thermoanaerobaculia bacterium]|jgi:tryptophan 2,3-dioxygenase|nr:tryptophan 2,3-dioxygenase family protein [Thermoanaerobaculia bacterium]